MSQPAFVILLMLLAVVLAAGVQALLRLRRDDMDGARSAGLWMAILLALPLIAWLSVNAMQRNWP
ncbi:hypothetical protein JQK88_29640 [Mesorhizobium caraganae]|uniref:hypothetical protein n=1 Tax=Mesorhizobium caraganae TaxID=483206 RepID=UPI00177DDDD8|nr:hypothetical protein [Mesorhizobium caraganae]MBM2715298.1 hypothetical protein [Mesorhizobium caraganae]